MSRADRVPAASESSPSDGYVDGGSTTLWVVLKEVRDDDGSMFGFVVVDTDVIGVDVSDGIRGATQFEHGHSHVIDVGLRVQRRTRHAVVEQRTPATRDRATSAAELHGTVKP